MALVGENWWERGGDTHGAGSTLGRRRRERWLGLEKGGGKGSTAYGPARQAGRSMGWAERPNRPVGWLGLLGRN
jgi:hypothetical protein